MLILGINSSHNATACLLKNGQVKACVSEERLTRVKNQRGIPYLAIKECLKIAGYKITDIDYLVLNYLDPKIHTGFSILKMERGRTPKINQKNLAHKILSILWSLKELTLTHIPQSRYVMDIFLRIFYKYSIDPKLEKKVLQEIETNLNIPRSKILKVDHHTAHGLAAYYSSPFPKDKPILIFTLDSSGDGVCASVSIGVGDKIERVATTASGSSLSDLYMHTTAYLGMKPLEHEHKVMGLAAYSDDKHLQPILNKLKGLVWVNQDLTFGTKIHSHMFYKILPKLFAYERFDNIAASVQKYTEEMVCEWIRLSTKKIGISDIVCGGGTFMNVKVNQRILQMKEVRSLFVMPSAADESTAIGSAYWGYQQQKIKDPSLPEIQSINDLYPAIFKHSLIARYGIPRWFFTLVSLSSETQAFT